MFARRIITYASLCAIASRQVRAIARCAGAVPSVTGARAMVARDGAWSALGIAPQQAPYGLRSRYKRILTSSMLIEDAFERTVRDIASVAGELALPSGLHVDGRRAHVVDRAKTTELRRLVDMLEASMKTYAKLENMGYFVQLTERLAGEEPGAHVSRDLLRRFGVSLKELKFDAVMEQRELRHLKHAIHLAEKNCGMEATGHDAVAISDEIKGHAAAMLQLLQRHFALRERALVPIIMQAIPNEDELIVLAKEAKAKLEQQDQSALDDLAAFAHERASTELVLHVVRAICSHFDVDDEEQRRTAHALLTDVQSYVPPDVWQGITTRQMPSVQEYLDPVTARGKPATSQHYVAAQQQPRFERT